MDFYFIDERGNDSINFETVDSLGGIEKYKNASKYFQLAVLKINKDSLTEFQSHFNSIRYFLNLTHEFDRIITAKKPFSKLWDVIEHLQNNGDCSLLTTYIEKELYRGPYLYFQQAHRFRIFSIYRTLSYAMKSFKTDNSAKTQVIIDRFPMTTENEINAIEYLRNNLSKFYNEIEIAFIDSRCSDYLQVVDVVMRVVHEKKLEQNRKFNAYNTDFILIKNFTLHKFKESGCSPLS